MFKFLSCGVILLLLLSGCAADKIPSLPVEIQTIAVDRQPHSVCRSFTPDRLLVSCFGREKIVEIYLAKQAVSKTYTVRKGPTYLVRQPNKKRIYCLHNQENVLAILGGDPLRVKRTLSTGSMTLAGAAIRPGTNQLWVCDGVSAVNVLVTPRIQLKKKIQLGRYPQNIVFTADGKLALITLKGENAVVIVDARTGEKVTTIEVGIYPKDILMVGNTACVSNFGSHDISLLDVGKREERVRIPVRKKPNRMAAHKNTLWVSCEKSYRIVAIDVAKAKVIGTVKTGFYPGAILALKDGSLVVAAPQKHKVAIIKPQNQSGNE